MPDQEPLLIVEDDDGFAELLKTVLERHKYSVAVVRTGQEALKWIETHPVSLLILDNGLPDMKGIEVVERIRKVREPIPFVTITGNGDERVAVQLMKQGARDYIVKDGAFLEAFPLSVAKVLEQLSLEKRLAAAETDLRHSEEHFRMLVQSISDHAIFRLNRDGTIASWNTGAERITGFKSAEIISRKLSDLTPPDDRSSSSAFLAAVTHDDKVDFEGWRLRKDGSRFWAYSVISPVRGADGEVSGFACVIRDLTDRKIAEDAIRNANLVLEQRVRERTTDLEEANERLRETTRVAEEANKAKDIFLATISHELRTPLTPIIGWSRLLRTSKFSDVERDRGLEVIERNAKVQAQLVEDLLDVSRIITGKLALTFDTVDLASIVDQSIDVVRPTATAKGIVIETKCDGSAHVSCDGTRLKQIFWNLITNAIKFTPKNGHIVVSIVREKENVRVEVSDDGEGIAAEDIPHLFERFWQVDGSCVRQHGGLGLGLAIVQHLVRLHNGTVHANSAGQGKGATFVVTLPVAKGPSDSRSAPAPVLADAEPPSLKGVKILLVEDELDTREMISFMLRRSGAVVEVVASVKDAEAALQRGLPDILISDLSMPEEDGFSLIQKLRDNPSMRDLPAIALTAYAGEESRLRVLNAGFQAHLAKPADPVELGMQILQYIHRK